MTSRSSAAAFTLLGFSRSSVLLRQERAGSGQRGPSSWRRGERILLQGRLVRAGAACNCSGATSPLAPPNTKGCSWERWLRPAPLRRRPTWNPVHRRFRARPATMSWGAIFPTCAKRKRARSPTGRPAATTRNAPASCARSPTARSAEFAPRRHRREAIANRTTSATTV